MTRRLLIVLAVGLVLVAPAAGDDLHGRKAAIDARIARLRGHVETVRQREATLRTQIAAVTTKIRTLEAQVGDVSAQLQTLEADLALHRERLAKLNELYAMRTRKLLYLRAQYRASVERLDRRLVAIYESEEPDLVRVVLSADSFQSLLDQVDYVNQIGEQDKRIAAQVRAARDDVAAERVQTRRAQASVASETQAIAVRTQQKVLVRDELVTSRGRLASARDRQKVSLDQLSAQDRAEAEEIDALQAQSANLAARIQAAQAAAQRQQGSPAAAAPATAPGSLIWPVQGPVTSPFGWRWGRMHEGIDIGVPSGTPIHAAAAGSVIYSGWMEGYGNLVVLDDGGGIATAYAHQSSIAVALGQAVEQGQVIGYVGCTGHCTGPHLHFEVRVGGSPVDPLGYL